MDNSILPNQQNDGTTIKNNPSITQRIGKYWFHYVVVIPAMLLILIFKIIPFIYAVYLPFTNYQVTRGIFNSQWVGLQNFNKLFANPNFRNVLSNTLAIKLEFVFFTAIVSLILALALSSIRSSKLRNIFATFFLIPFFIPSAVLASVLIYMFSPSGSPVFKLDALVLTDPAYFRLILVGAEVLKTAGIPIALALAAICSKHSQIIIEGDDAPNIEANFTKTNIIPAVKAITAFMILQFSSILSTDFELIFSLYNPLVYKVADTLDTYAYRIGLLNTQFSMAGAIWFLQFCVQLLATLTAYFLLRNVFANSIFSKNAVNEEIRSGDVVKNSGGIIISLLYSALLFLPLYILFIYPFITKSQFNGSIFSVIPLGHVVGYVIIYVVTVVISLFITVTLAYPLTVKDLPGRTLYKVFLLAVIVMGAGSIIHEYFLTRALGMINTFFPQMIYGLFPILQVFVLKGFFNSRYSDLKQKTSNEGKGEVHSFFTIFLPKVWRPLLGLGVLQFVSLWNSFYPALVYSTNPKMYSPILLFRSIMSGASLQVMKNNPGDPIILKVGALICIPSILLFLVFRKFITSEVFISQTRKL